MKISNVFSLFFGMMLMVGTSSAALLLDDDPTDFYQQTTASPCVIGGNNCQNGTFPQTLAPGGNNGDRVEYYSPTYTIAAIDSIVPSLSSIIVGLDYNQTNVDQILYEFTVYTCTGPAAVPGPDTICAGASPLDQYIDPEGTTLGTNNNGVGWSDFLLTGLDLSGDGITHVQFYADWFNNDGADRYFLVGGDPGTPPEVPEPSTMLLMGGSLLGFAYFRRRKNS